MQTPLTVPIVLKRVQIVGSAGIREIDMILDTGAVYTVIAWDVVKDIGYDPAISPRRTPIITANGVIEAPLITVGAIAVADLRLPTDREACSLSNTFLATSVSFINEIANLCEVLEADALEVARILRLDKRIGPHAFLSPGLGFAGGTLGREIRALQKLGASHQVPMPLMDAVWQINAQRAQLVSRRLSAALGSLAGRQVGILGLTYKPGTSTLRRAISLDIEDRRRRDRRHRRLKKAEKGEKAEKAQKAQPSMPSDAL